MASVIPTTHLVPLFWATMDASGANTAVAGAYPTLLLGQKLAGGSGSVDTLCSVTSAAEVAEMFGVGSMIHRQAIAYFASDPMAEVWAFAVDDPDPGVAATGKLTLTGTATEDGIFNLELGGQALAIGVSTDDTADDVGAAIAAALPTHASAPNDYPVSASNLAGVVTFTAKWKGDSGNNIRLAVNPLGAAGRQITPAGIVPVITNTIGKLAGGSGAPDLSDLGGIIASFDLDHLVVGFSDWEDTLLTLATEFNDATGRWSYLRQQYGHVWAATQGTSSEVAAILAELNDQHLCLVPVEGSQVDCDSKVGNPPWEISAGYAALCAAAMRLDPAAGLYGLQLRNSSDGKVKFRAPARADRWGAAVRNSILQDGGATATYSRTGAILVERPVTTYTETGGGSPDTSYRNVQRLFSSMKWLRECRAIIESSFGTAKNDATTRDAIKGAIVAKYAELEALGIVEDTDGFAEALRVEQNSEDLDRVDILAPPRYVHQLNVVAFTNQLQP